MSLHETNCYGVNMSETIPSEEKSDIRDRLFKELTQIGNEKGFQEIEMTQTTTSETGEQMEWSIKVVFKRR